MLKYIFSLLLLVAGLSQSSAQIKATVQPVPPGASEKARVAKPTTPEGIAKSSADNLKKTLGLSEKQRTSIYKALLDHTLAVKQVKSSKLSNKEKYNKTVALDQARTKKFEAIMTKEQYKSYILTFP